MATMGPHADMTSLDLRHWFGGASFVDPTTPLTDANLHTLKQSLRFMTTCNTCIMGQGQSSDGGKHVSTEQLSHELVRMPCNS
jgi:hypothetical protein